MPSSLSPAERNRLIERHLDSVHSAANRVRVPKPVRDELVSAGYEALVLASLRYDPDARAAFPTFAFWPVLGSMYDCLSNQSRWSNRHRSIDADDSATFAVPCPRTPDPERQALTAQVLAAVEELPPLARDLIKSHFLDERKLAVAGSRVGISKTRASVHLGRAIQLLRNKLDDRFATWPSPSKATKPRYSPEVKAAVLQRAQAPSANIARLAAEVGVSAPTIHAWLKAARTEQVEGAAATPPTNGGSRS